MYIENKKITFFDNVKKIENLPIKGVGYNSGHRPTGLCALIIVYIHVT